MENKEAIDALNTLVEINNDRIEGYETATKETNEPDLKVLFTKLADTSRDCRIELEREVEQLGATGGSGTAERVLTGDAGRACEPDRLEPVGGCAAPRNHGRCLGAGDARR